jgi:hypothetical protein
MDSHVKFKKGDVVVSYCPCCSGELGVVVTTEEDSRGHQYNIRIKCSMRRIRVYAPKYLKKIGEL